MVHICKVCLQKVLQQRVQNPPVAKKGNPDNYCGLCAQSTTKLSAKSIKACTHEICTRVYCLPYDDDAPDPSEQTSGAKAVSAAASKQKKRKRRNEIEDSSTADEDEPEPPKPVRSTSDMQPVDYAVTYFKFLLQREIKDEFEESEDVCFCCKDGGDVIECDWKGMNGAFARCPKVYHEDCLGYEVPEGKTWDHLPKEVKKLGHATKDIPTSTYVVCPRCTQQAQDALKQKKIGSDIHSKILRRRR
ncbi:Zinc finger, RING/FYVE/PHD-type [Phytophthora cactorum]|nr:Zinc finger, RING/FYVE/PHD-type [Phytophthora cactorum]